MAVEDVAWEDKRANICNTCKRPCAKSMKDNLIFAAPLTKSIKKSVLIIRFLELKY